MAEKKSPAQLKAEGATLNEAVTLARKRELFFALSIGKDGLVLEVHPTKSPEVLWRTAKGNGGGPKGAMGVMTAAGKQVEFRCTSDDVPATLLKLCKRHFSERGVPQKFTFLTPSGPLGGGGEEDLDPDADDTDPPEGVVSAAVPDATGAPARPQAPSPPPSKPRPAPVAEVAAVSDEKPGSAPAAQEDAAQLRLDLARSFTALVARVDGRPEDGPVKKFRQMQKMFKGDLVDGDLKRAGALLALAGKLVDSLPEVLQSLPPEAEAKAAEVRGIADTVCTPDSPLEPEARDWLAGQLADYDKLMAKGDIAQAEVLLDDLYAKALDFGEPLPKLSPKTEAEIAAVDPRLLDSCLAPAAFASWGDDAVSAATGALQRACTELAPESELFRALEINLAALETEQLRRWEAEDALLTTSLSAEDLTAMEDAQISATIASLRLTQSPDAQGNLELLLQEQSKRASVDMADDVLLAAQRIDRTKALTSEISPSLDQLKALLDLPDLPPEMLAQMQAEVTRLDGVLADRDARADRLLAAAKSAPALALDTDAPEVKALLKLLPGGAVVDFIADFEEAKAGFSVGVASGYADEAPVTGIDHPPVKDWGAFYLSYNVGLLKGVWLGLKGLFDAVVMVADVATKVAPYILNPFKLAWEAAKFGVGEVADYISDRDAYVAKRKAQVEQVMKVVRALEALQAEFDVNSFGMGSQVGTVVGKVLAGYEKDFAGLSDAAKGELIGKVVGAIAFEIITEAILAVATEGMGNVARAGLLTAQATKGSARFAGLLEGVVRNVPAIRRFLKALGMVEDVADVADDAADLKKLIAMADALKKKRRAELPDRPGAKPKPDGGSIDPPDKKPDAEPQGDAPKPDEGGGSGKDGGNEGDGGGGGGGDGSGGDPPDGPPKPDPRQLAQDIAKMPADKESVKAISKALDEAGDVTEVARAASAKLDEIGKRADDLPGISPNGRKPPPEKLADGSLNPARAAWDDEVDKLYEAKREVEALRVQVKKRLADTKGMPPDEIAELEKLKEGLDQNLLKLHDVEPGHGPVNHVNVTDEGLMDRAARKINPRYENFQNASPAVATRIKGADTYLDAAELAKVDFADPTKTRPDVLAALEKELADDAGATFFKVEIPLDELLGPDYANKVDGVWRVGSANPPLSASKLPPSEFAGQTGTVQYNLINGKWEVTSIYPNTAKSPRPTSGGEKIYDAATQTWGDPP